MIDLSPFEWASQHLQIVGWPALLVIAWRLRGYIEKIFQKWDQVDSKTTESLEHLIEVKTAIGETAATLATISSNHLAHIESGIVELNSRHDKHLETLASIDKGISVLVDRSGRSFKAK
jgi:hypothetical protein